MSACRRSQRIGGPGRGGAGCDRPADRGLARHSDTLPGSPAQLSHHLLAPCVRYPAQTVGESPRCWRPAKDTLLQKGIFKICLKTEL